MFYYFYKITNLVNNKFYYGVHSTENLNDNYMGSGKILKRAIDKYGPSNFRKDIIKFFSNRLDMFNYEREVVNEALVNDRNCYNCVVGGKGGGNFSKDIIKKLQEKRSITCSKNGTYKIIGEKLKEYYKNNPEEASRISKIRAKKRDDLYRERPDIKKDVYSRVSSSLLEFWSNCDEEYRKNKGENLKNSEAFKKSILKISQKNQGYSNPDFRARWKNIYEEYSEEICELIKYSNLTEQFIIKDLFNKKVKIPKILSYYEYMKFLPKKLRKENKQRFLSENSENGYRDGISTKTYYSNELKYNICLYIEEFFNLLPTILKINRDFSISDSMILQGSNYIKNYKSAIDYFQEMGVLYDKERIEIKVKVLRNGDSFLKKSSKSVYKVNYYPSTIIMDKEFNTYEFDNGKFVQKGRLQLSINGDRKTL